MKRAPRTKKEAVLLTGHRAEVYFLKMGYLSFRVFLVELTLIHIINLIHPAAAVKTSHVGLLTQPADGPRQWLNVKNQVRSFPVFWRFRL